MDTNKIGEQFEAAFVAKYGFGRLAASANADAHAMYEAAKWAWQASREAVVVGLPIDVSGGLYRLALEDCARCIEAQGLKVAP